MSAFPETSMTLLRKIAVQVTGEREAAWVRFFGLYEPAIKRFVAYHDSAHDPDDVVQEVLMKLVGVLREGRFKPGPVPFRAYLVTLIRRHLVSLWRKDQARGAGLFVPLEEDSASVPPEVAELIDLDWRLAKRRAAVEHVLTKTALSERDRAVYKFYVQERNTIEDTAEKFRLTRNNVSQIKTRIERRIAAIGREMAASAEKMGR